MKEKTYQIKSSTLITKKLITKKLSPYGFQFKNKRLNFSIHKTVVEKEKVNKETYKQVERLNNSDKQTQETKDRSS